MPPLLVPVQEQGGRLGWSLLAANGRPIARSAVLYRSDGELAAVFREMFADRNSLTFGVSRDSGRLWSWTASLPPRSVGAAGRPVARSARGYLRQDQCRQGASRFVAALGVLPPDGGLVERAVNEKC